MASCPGPVGSSCTLPHRAWSSYLEELLAPCCQGFEGPSLGKDWKAAENTAQGTCPTDFLITEGGLWDPSGSRTGGNSGGETAEGRAGPRAAPLAGAQVETSNEQMNEHTKIGPKTSGYGYFKEPGTISAVWPQERSRGIVLVLPPLTHAREVGGHL